MKFFSWNVRGFNHSSRQLCVKNLISNNGPLIGGILETRVEEENASGILHSTFPGWNYECNYEFAELGRIWVVWDPALSVFIYKKSAQYILCGVFDPASASYFTVAFIYAFNTEGERRDLWRDISTLSANPLLRNSPFVLTGDFNQILNAEEHYSIAPYDLPVRGMEEFRSCLESNSLTDLSSRGCFFTWSNRRPEDPILRKLDRVLVNQSWLSTFLDSSVVFDPPGESDHSPILISLEESTPRGKKSFKYFSFISSHTEFSSQLRAAWKNQTTVGSQLFMLSQKLTRAKECCKSLNRQGFSNIQQRTKDALLAMEEAQAALLTDPNEDLVLAEQEARESWNFFASALQTYFRVKSRIRWLRDGDANTRFFHKAVIAHHSWNVIRYLRNAEGLRIHNVEQIKGMTVAYFKCLLGSDNRGLTTMSVEEIQDLHPFRCSVDLASKLTRIPTDEEIRESFFKMPKSKAPGPDGFSVEFFLDAWEIVGSDAISAVKEFFVSGRMLPKFNTTTIALIPKIKGADDLSNFRPISCCSTIYKVIARILKKRLKLFVPEAVQMNQVGFLKGRFLCENVLLASELVSGFHKRGTTTRGCLQIDLTKAYDNLSWDFLLNILQALELPEVFINWIVQCFTTTSFSIAFNGELLDHFPGKKGLRQGDPISSLLFVLAMDILSKSLDKAAIDNRFRVHPLCEAPLITHISFADDVLLFFDGTESSLQGLLSVLDEFQSVSGLGVNRSKTAVFFDGGNARYNREVASRFGLKQGSFPVRYLGVPLTTKKLTKQDYQPLIDKLHSRFTSWTVRHLSFAGRLQLLKSVIYSTITFWASIFLLPNSCLRKLEQMCSGFLWKGVPTDASGAKVAWDSVCKSRESGGLGLKRIGLWNKVLGLKLIWLLFSAAGSLWVSWVKIHLLRSENFWTLVPDSGCWIWKFL